MLHAKVTLWPSLVSTQGAPYELPWSTLFERFSAAGHFLGDNQHPGWSAARFEPPVRKKDNVKAVCALVLDYDGTESLEAIVKVWGKYLGFVHATRRHAPEAPRYRVILPFKREVTPEEYSQLWLHAWKLSGEKADKSTKDESRFWFQPGMAEGGVYEFKELKGEPINPDVWLKQPKPNTLAQPKAPQQTPPQVPKPNGSQKDTAYGLAALDGEITALRNAGEGERNKRLNEAALKLSRNVAGGHLSEATAKLALATTAKEIGLSEQEIPKTINSGWQKGQTQPREREERKPQVEITEQNFKKHNASEIFAPLPPVDWLVESLDLCPGAPSLVAGYGYSGKTVSVQSLAISIVTGNKAWGAFHTRKGKVLHVDYEQGKRLTFERYQRLAKALLITPDELEGLHVVTLPSVYLDQANIEDQLSREFAGYALVIIDSFKASNPSVEENSSDARILLDTLGRVSERTGATIIVIHHCRKPQKDSAGGARMAIRGSGAIYDACSSVLVFEGQKGKPTRVIHDKARTTGVTAEDFVLKVQDVEIDGDLRGGLVVLAQRAKAKEDEADEEQANRRRVKLERIAEQLRELFRADSEQAGVEEMATLIGRRTGDVREALKLLVSSNQVSVVGSTTNRSYVWHG